MAALMVPGFGVLRVRGEELVIIADEILVGNSNNWRVGPRLLVWM